MQFNGDWHMGRSRHTHELEDACPCPKEACGLVSIFGMLEDCPEHGPRLSKTMRQGHRAEACPAPASGPGLAVNG